MTIQETWPGNPPRRAWTDRSALRETAGAASGFAGAVCTGAAAWVAIRPTVSLKDGYLDAHELALLTRWVDLNRDALIKYWDGEIESTSDVLRVLKPIAAL